MTESKNKEKGWVYFIPGQTWLYLKLSGAWDLPLQSLAAGPISSTASPSPGRIPFDQAWSSAERGFHLLAPLSLSWLVAASAPILQQQEEMKEVSSTGTLSGQGQCSDPSKLAPDLAECVCVCVYFPAAPQPPTVDKTVRILWSNIKAIRWRVKMFFFFLLLPLLLQHMLAVGETIKMFWRGNAENHLSSWTQCSVAFRDLKIILFSLNKTYDSLSKCCMVPLCLWKCLMSDVSRIASFVTLPCSEQ